MEKRSLFRSVAAAGLCLALGGGLAGQAMAVDLDPEDELLVPAMDTHLAAQSLLIDIDRAGDRVIAVGERGHIIYSDDDGETWIQASVPVSATLTGVHFPTDDKGWAVGHSGVILHSSDGGETWEHQFDGRDGIPQVIAYYDERIQELEDRMADEDDPDVIADIEWELDELIFTQEDLEFDLEDHGPWEPMLDVWFENEEHGIAVGAYGHMYRTTDGGENWETHLASIDNPERYHLNSIDQTPDGALFIAAESGYVFRSDDNGDSWDMLETPYTGSFFGVVGGADDEEILAFGLRGNIFRSSDQGSTWTSVDSGTTRTLNSGFSTETGEVAIVGNEGAVLFSDDGGRTFNEYIRASRHSYVGVAITAEGGLILVGERGALRTDHRGRDLLL